MCPDHTTSSRRKPKLGKVPFYQVKQKTPLHILIDSSGLAVHAGQLRRAQKSRDYRKLHLCVDEQSGEVVAGELTSKRARDSSRVASLVGQIESDRRLLAGERRLGFRPASKLAVEILQSVGRSNRFPHGTREFVEGQQLITGLL